MATFLIVLATVILTTFAVLFLIASAELDEKRKHRKRRDELQERLFSPDQNVVELYPAVSWICPGCGKRKFERVVVTEVTDHGGAQYQLKGKMSSAVCEKCHKVWQTVPGPGIEITYK